MQRKYFHEKKKAKRLSPYRRMEAELANARDALKNAVDKYMELFRGLEEALKIIDEERGGTKSGYSREDSAKLERLRKLVKP